MDHCIVPDCLSKCRRQTIRPSLESYDLPTLLPSSHSTRHIKKMKTTPKKPIDITPTFPLCADEIDGWRQALIERTPKFQIWQNLALLGTRFALLSRFSKSWSGVESNLNKAVVEHIIKQNNAAQDELIRSFIRTLYKAHWDLHAAKLREFLWMKQRIEKSLVNNKKMATQRADIETCLLYTSPSPRDQRGSRMPSSA